MYDDLSMKRRYFQQMVTDLLRYVYFYVKFYAMEMNLVTSHRFISCICIGYNTLVCAYKYDIAYIYIYIYIYIICNIYIYIYIYIYI